MGDGDDLSSGSKFVSRPCSAVNPCDRDSVLSAAEASFFEGGHVRSTASSSVPVCRSGAKSAAAKERSQPRSISGDSSAASSTHTHAVVTHAQGAPQSHVHAIVGGARNCSLLQSNSTGAGQTNLSVDASAAPQHVDEKHNYPVTLDSLSEDGKLACMHATPCAAGNVAAAAGNTANGLSPSSPFENDTIPRDTGNPRRRSDASTTCTCTPNSLHSRNSSHDINDALCHMHDAEQAGQRGWWKRRNRSLFLGEDPDQLLQVEHALDTVVSVHDTDSLMYHEIMLPVWELTPVRFQSL